MEKSAIRRDPLMSQLRKTAASRFAAGGRRYHICAVTLQSSCIFPLSWMTLNDKAIVTTGGGHVADALDLGA